MVNKYFITLFSILLIQVKLGAQHLNIKDRYLKIDLSGEWFFAVDSLSIGEKETWFTKRLPDKVKLPGSMTTNSKGNEIAVNTSWTGSIFDSSWFFKPEYEQYRQQGDIKIPFWLQPTKHYKGMAWYQKEIVIPVSWADKQIELFIERSHWESTVWLDDRKIGMQNSLSTAQIFNLNDSKPGKHRLTIRVDNSIHEINVGQNSHSISDHTQTNWNGMIGQLFITAKPLIFIDKIQLYPDIDKKEVLAKFWLKNGTGKPVSATLEMRATTRKKPGELNKIQHQINIASDSLFFETSYPMGNSPLMWNEFEPNLYSMETKLFSGNTVDEKKETFGMRKFKAEGTQFAINNRKVFLRGTLECAVFPLTGYPPTDAQAWTKIFNKMKSYGLNHVRFHSWCPPAAAFDAADSCGIYLQIECASWANWGSALGSGAPIDQYIYAESERIVNAYGNHPSFCMLTHGNEPGGEKHIQYLTSFVNYWKKKDARRVYTTGAGWPVINENDFNNISDPRIQHWAEGLKSIINSKNPSTDYDWRKIIAQYNIPTVSHEIGQWCVFPDLKEIKKYTGVLKPRNFEIFKDRLKVNGLEKFADSFLLASGKLQALCYKADIEAALRTPDFAGFQLLGLNDFPGQGTALVGVLNPFWQDKGYTTAKEYSKFCNTTVPLSRFPKMVYLNNEQLSVPVEVAHFGATALKSVEPLWMIKNSWGKILFRGKLPAKDIEIGNAIQLGEIIQDLSTIKEAVQLTLTVSISSFQNSWDFFVYPSVLPLTGSDVLVTQQIDSNAITTLSNGGHVLLTIKKGSIKPEMGGKIAVGFSSIFWNTAWTNGQPPHTLGILCNPKDPALKEFPSDYYSNWQWWDAMTHSNVIMLDSVVKGLKPIVRVIDDWVTSNSLGLIFECTVGKGKLLVTSIDLITDNEKRLEARQLLYSLKKYIVSKSFNPKQNVDINRIKNILSSTTKKYLLQQLP